MRVKLYDNDVLVEPYETFEELVKDGFIDEGRHETESWEQLSKGEVVALAFGYRVEPV